MNEISLDKAKKTFFTALTIDIFVTAIFVAIDFWTVNVLEGFASGGPPLSASTIGYIELFERFSSVMVLTWLWVGWTLTRWISACYQHATQTLNFTGFRHEKWKTWGWVIPGLNLFKPFQVLNEIYKVGSSNSDDGRALKKWTFSAPLLIWWIYWVSTHLILVGISKLVLNQTSVETLTPKQAIGAYYVHIVVCLISLTVAGLWFVVAGSLTRRLHGRGSVPIKTVVSPIVGKTETSNDSYAAALAEIEEGRLDKGTWARSFAESGGDESKAKALYIKARAEAIKSALVGVDTQPPIAEDVGVKVANSRDGTSDKPATFVAPLPVLLILVGVAVIGIVAAVALPAYQDYTKRQAVAASAVPAKSFSYEDAVGQAKQQPVAPSQVETPAQPVDWSQFTPSPGPAPTPQIDGFQFNPSANSPTGANAPKPAQPRVIHKDKPKQREGFSPEAQADLDFIAARAMSDYPYLATPAGKIVMEKIISKRDELIGQGTYPALALTQAVNAFAPANAPLIFQEKVKDTVQRNDAFSQGGCRWATAKDWVCN